LTDCSNYFAKQMTKIYWHNHEFRFELRQIQARYPKTYQKVGKILQEQGVLEYNKDWKNQTKQDVLREWLSILQYMPKHVIPYGPMGDDRKWGEIDWTRRTTDLITEAA